MVGRDVRCVGGFEVGGKKEGRKLMVKGGRDTKGLGNVDAERTDGFGLDSCQYLICELTVCEGESSLVNIRPSILRPVYGNGQPTLPSKTLRYHRTIHSTFDFVSQG